MFCRFLVFVFIVGLFFSGQVVYGRSPGVDVEATAAVLLEAESGRVLFGQNEDRRIYPAGMTKILTALVVLEHLDPDDVLVVGTEIQYVPDGSSMSGHVVGEHITVHNLLRALFIMPGNETANVLAIAVARELTGDEDIQYEVAERFFANLMNQQAVALGAVNSNFTNPHGFHDNNLFTTPMDMALIARAAMENEFIRELAGEYEWTGDGGGPDAESDWLTRQYTMQTNNLLITPGGPHFYRYATGVRTGRHSLAGDSLAAAAHRDGIDLIAVISDSTDPGRWRDAVSLFEYGFATFNYAVIQEAMSIVGEISVQNPRLQEDDVMEFYMAGPVYGFFSQGDLDNLSVDIFFMPGLITDDPEPQLLAPIFYGQILGQILFSIGDRVLYEGYIYAARDAYLRSWQTDFDHYRNHITETMFTRAAIPYWIIAALSLIIITYIIYRLATRKRGRGGRGGRGWY